MRKTELPGNAKTLTAFKDLSNKNALIAPEGCCVDQLSWIMMEITGNIIL